MTKNLLSAFVSARQAFFTKVKDADETRVSDTTLTADAELKFQAKANKTYFVRIFVLFNAHTSPDAKGAISIPAGATALRIDDVWSGTTALDLTDWTIEDIWIGDLTDNRAVALYGRIVMGATAGEVALVWAQNASSVEDTTVLKGSFMEAYES